MKLRTKIILTSCLVLLMSSLAINLLILVLLQKSYNKEAEISTYQDSFVSFMELGETIESLGGKVDGDVMYYILKKTDDDYLVCVRENSENTNLFDAVTGNGTSDVNEIIFNHTILTPTDLESVHYSDAGAFNQTTVYSAKLSWENRHFLVYRVYMGNYALYKLEDITYIQNRLRVTALGMAAFTAAVLAAAFLILPFLLKKILDPLRELKETAMDIASGNYDRRIRAPGKDEIGELGGNFNLMAEAVKARTGQLEESERRKSMFMGNLTHELKTPLTAISGYAKTLLSVNLPEQDREEALSYIYSESRRLERLSKKMMGLTLLGENESFDFQTVSAKDLFERAKESCSVILSDKNITLECHENGERFCADPDLMADVLVNLTDNAVKASDAGSRVILSAEPGKISVRDFGRGIPAEEKEKILEPFYMIDKSRSRKAGGAGLGLSITALILKKHGCGLEIESEPGEGTCMGICFPEMAEIFSVN